VAGGAGSECGWIFGRGVGDLPSATLSAEEQQSRSQTLYIMNQNQFERWTQVREKGKDNFVWMQGVAGWGFATGLLYAVVSQLWKYQWDVEALLSMNFVRHLAFSLMFFALAGFVFGRIVWSLSEKKWKEKEENGNGN